MFFKDNAPHVEDYDRTRDELVQLGWLQKIYNIEYNKNVYDTTSIGYQYYFAICMKVNCDQLFAGPRLTEGQTSAYINEDIDLEHEGFLIDGIDGAKMTPMAAEYLYVLTDSQGKDATPTIKLNKKNGKPQNSNQKTEWGSKLGIAFAQFMKGMQSMSKAAQQYDKSSTKATQSAWGTQPNPFSRQKVAPSKKKRRKTRKTKKTRNTKNTRKR